jgi:hypothetical protein
MAGFLLGLPSFLAAPRAEEPQAAHAAQTAEDLGEEVKIFDGKTLENWRTIDTFDFIHHGRVSVQDGVIRLERGKPATGISWKKELPKSNYEISWSARRVEGSDFFCGLTFPVKEEFCTLILGGWGGQVVGLSNIDGFSAVENNTTQSIDFKNGQWYRLRLRVSDEAIHIWLDDRQIIDVETKNKKFSIWWEQDPVRPLGIVTWYTTAELKDLKMHRLRQ